jgi:hypothetical protein
MIGGADLVLDGRSSLRDADLILRTMRMEWPHALIQRVDSEDAKSFSELSFPIVGLDEFLIYRDAECFNAWQKYGATQEFQSGMMHVIISADCLTIVVDAVGSPLAELANEILQGVAINRVALASAA